jgi:cupin superfamily acireductone dioxygenase involved in methionine salvage
MGGRVFGNALGSSLATLNQAPAPTANVSKDLEKLNLVDAQATEIASMLDDPDQRQAMADRLGGDDKLASFEKGYKNNLMSEHSYLTRDVASVTADPVKQQEMLDKLLVWRKRMATASQ